MVMKMLVMVHLSVLLVQRSSLSRRAGNSPTVKFSRLGPIGVVLLACWRSLS